MNHAHRISPAIVFSGLMVLAACQSPVSQAPSAAEPALPPGEPDCPAHIAAPAEPFRARGQEPSWSLTAGDGRLELVTQFGQQTVSLPVLEVTHAGCATRYSAADAERRLVATITRGVCRDTMSGMPHPYAVEVQTDDERLSGCGGEPLSLLTGRGWIIEDLDGGGIIDRSRITLGFSGEDSRAYGLGSCNRFTGGFTLTGEGLSFTHPAATMMACAPAVMAQEQKFFRILQAVTSFNIDATGALILSGSGGTMKAYRDTAPIM
jgi:heat shock protein HslJ